jgi:hypothetical protein
MKHNNSDSQLAAALNKPGVMQTLPLSFVEWYSGMQREKILRAYERWKKESGIVAVGDGAAGQNGRVEKRSKKKKSDNNFFKGWTDVINKM